MTRINVVDPSELVDQHLLAEHRELTRIPNDIVKRNGNVPLSKEPKYLLGAGHVTFFRDKLLFLKDRYDKLYNECIYRGFKVTYSWPDSVIMYKHLWNDYEPTLCDISLNRERLKERMPVKPRYLGKPLIIAEE